MPVPSPPIDPRTFDDLVDTTETLAKAYTGWQPPAAGNPDLGSALVRIFARMAAQVVDRVNRMPDRNFLAFANLVGIEPSPPRPARVPLTFHLVPGGTTDAIVPAGTRVAAQPSAGEQAEVVFETALDLVATRAVLTSVFAHWPDKDEYIDRTAEALGADRPAYLAFKGYTPIERALYVASDEVFALPAGTSITLSIKLGSNQLSAWQDLMSMIGPAPDNTPLVEWSYWNGGAWKDLQIGSNQQPPSNDTWTLTFSASAEIVPTEILGRRSRWVRARLRWWPEGHVVPLILGITVSANYEVKDNGLLPDLALQNGRPLDMSADFFPLGERPRFNDMFHLASQAAFGKRGADITLNVAQSAAREDLEDDDKPTIAWEVWTGQLWEEVGRSTKDEANTDQVKYPNFSDTTKAFKVGLTEGDPDAGKVKFTVPQNVAPATLQGNIAYWIRARLVSSNLNGNHNYGLGITVNGQVVTDDGYRPPILELVTIDAAHTPSVPAEALVTNNELFSLDHTADLANGFVPFISSLSLETMPALYLGFDRPFENRAMMLYVEVRPHLDFFLLNFGLPPPAEVVWEYSVAPSNETPLGWAPLGAVDETQGLSRSGLVRFIGPLDFALRAAFGQTRYWLRARWHKDDFVVPQILGRISTNTVWATHTATARNEVLSSVERDGVQVFKTARAPILAGQQIEVRELGIPSLAERTLIEQLEGTSAVTIVADASGHPEEVWVRWHAVPDFHASGPRDRHYAIDRENGELRFGDGLSGMAPPRGAKSVRAAFYQTGGGASGNRPAGTITALKTTIPYVDAVINHEPSTGGADGAGLDELRERGLVSLRHGGRAIAAEDYEDLARAASPAVARVRAITASFDPIALAEDPNPPSIPDGVGEVTLIVVPMGTDPQSTPALGLLRDVEAAIKASSSPAALLKISPPDWIKVTVAALIVPTALERADAVRPAVVAALQQFLHPLTGGADGKGWELGRLPHKSDVYPLVTSIDGVDYVRSLTMSFARPDKDSPGDIPVTEQEISEMTEAELARVLTYSGLHSVTIHPPGP